MPWWGWIIFGALLLGSELLVIDAGFYLVFIGIAAAITGLIELTGIGLEPWLQWILFSVIALMFMVLFRKKLYDMLRGSGVGYDSSPVGEIVRLEQTLQPGDKTRLELRGTNWTAVNDSKQILAAGSRVQISRVDGLTLKLDIINEQEKGE
jgi:membrane protein implicated in regulation of membrane protease activity